MSQVDTPTRILYDKQRKPFDGIKDIACGANHCVALNSEGTTVYSWGGGQGGRLGHGDETGE
jgi:alpha-tubulin suppressor-like RCC1 family protein